MLFLSWVAAPFVAETCVKSLVVSGFFGIGEFFLGVLMASLSSALLAGDFSLHDYVLKPIFWVVPTGIVPAFALGIVGGAIARRAARAQTQERAEETSKAARAAGT